MKLLGLALFFFTGHSFAIADEPHLSSKYFVDFAIDNKEALFEDLVKKNDIHVFSRVLAILSGENGKELIKVQEGISRVLPNLIRSKNILYLKEIAHYNNLETFMSKEAWKSVSDVFEDLDKSYLVLLLEQFFFSANSRQLIMDSGGSRELANFLREENFAALDWFVEKLGRDFALTYLSKSLDESDYINLTLNKMSGSIGADGYWFDLIRKRKQTGNLMVPLGSEEKREFEHPFLSYRSLPLILLERNEHVLLDRLLPYYENQLAQQVLFGSDSNLDKHRHEYPDSEFYRLVSQGGSEYDFEILFGLLDRASYYLLLEANLNRCTRFCATYDSALTPEFFVRGVNFLIQERSFKSGSEFYPIFYSLLRKWMYWNQKHTNSSRVGEDYFLNIKEELLSSFKNIKILDPLVLSEMINSLSRPESYAVRKSKDYLKSLFMDWALESQNLLSGEGLLFYKEVLRSRFLSNDDYATTLIDPVNLLPIYDLSTPSALPPKIAALLTIGQLQHVIRLEQAFSAIRLIDAKGRY